jgi:hypothetical protein
MNDTADLPDVRVEKRKEYRQQGARVITIPRGLSLIVGDQRFAINYTQAEGLFESLLKVLPIPNRIDLAWQQRYEPTIQIRTFYDYIEDEVQASGYQAELLVLDNIVFRTKIWPELPEAVAKANEWYGRTLRHVHTFDCPGSRERAKTKMIFAKAEEYAKSQGITLEELMRMAGVEAEENE